MENLAKNIALGDSHSASNLEPLLGDLPAGRPSRHTSIHIIQPRDTDVCNFWIGLFQRGTTNPNQLFENPTIADVLEKVAGDGPAEDEPVMLSDATTHPNRFIYLLPYQADRNQNINEMTETLATTVQSWGTTKVGIHLSSQILEQSQWDRALHAILKRLISSTKVDQYFLMLGESGANKLLNTALDIKFDMEPSTSVYVFH